MKYLILFVLLCGSTVLVAKDLLVAVEVVAHRSLPATEVAALTAEVNQQWLLDGSSEFDLQLPDGSAVTAVLDRLQQRGPNRFSWFGHLKGQPQEQMIISVVGGYYSGALYTKQGVFEFTAAGQHRMRVAALQTSEFPGCDGGVVPDDLAPHKHVAQAAGGTDSFDVLVVYTPQARNAAGGTAAIEATAQAAVDAMNLAFNNSGVAAEAVLVYAGLANYNDTGSSSDDLQWVSSNSEVAALRNAYGADMVSLLANNIGGSCGRGYIMTNPGPGFAGAAFQVTARGCAVGNLSFAHEFGHNMGLDHNPENSNISPANASNPWSYGHYHNNSYRTVLSYSAQCNNGCGRRPYFSNPDVQYNGLPTGVANTRDNARTLEQTAAIVAGFRPRVVDLIYSDGFE